MSEEEPLACSPARSLTRATHGTQKNTKNHQISQQTKQTPNIISSFIGSFGAPTARSCGAHLVCVSLAELLWVTCRNLPALFLACVWLVLLGLRGLRDLRVLGLGGSATGTHYSLISTRARSLVCVGVLAVAAVSRCWWRINGTDYMRQYTWDKQLETWVKSARLINEKGKAPTVISPLQYKRRFRDAMWNYFVMVLSKRTRAEHLDVGRRSRDGGRCRGQPRARLPLKRGQPR